MASGREGKAHGLLIFLALFIGWGSADQGFIKEEEEGGIIHWVTTESSSVLSNVYIEMYWELTVSVLCER